MSGFRIDSTNIATLVLTNGETGAYVNDADVEITVMDHIEREADGQVWPVAMPYVAASDGVYRVQLSADIEFSQHTSYIAEVVIISPSIGKLTIRQKGPAFYDDGDPSTT